MGKISTHTIIVSDLHLGSKICRAKAIKKMLESYSYKKLILLGDIFDSLDFTDLARDHWEVLAYIGRQSSKVKIKWIQGNHDLGLIKIAALLMGVKVYKKYKWKFDNKKFIAIHGHQFDRFLVKNAFLSFIISYLYFFIQLLDLKNRRLTSIIKNKSKGWLRLSQKVADSALIYARLYRCDYVFCGHTHYAMKKSKGKVTYYNSGCWTDIPSNFITIDKKNGIQIHNF
ncbi:MAG: UDP-2,3-diacylglucosamine diphosphatase [Candidatus Moranbacteria bacterium]|nr:UDP-2,3-diacylglucosamine diphosphatase [Candidatus Moranbacteria bacterium]